MLLNLQILRAFAAMAVAFFNIDVPSLPLGSFGVHIFFVISGFIIAHSCATHPEYFFRRRIIRIVPAYWACTLALFCIALWRPEWLHYTTANIEHLLKSLFFIPYRKESGLMQPMLNVGWTLNYEMLFYLIVAASLWIVKGRFAPALGAIVLATALHMLPKFCASEVCVFYAQPISYEFCYGIAAYYLWRTGWLQKLPRALWIAACLFCLPALPLLEAGKSITFFTMSTASTLLVFSAVMLERAFTPAWKKFLVAAGDASYLAYLIHMFVIQWFNKAGLFSLHSLPGIVVCLFTILAVSMILHHFFEKPLLNFLKRAWLPSRH